MFSSLCHYNYSCGKASSSESVRTWQVLFWIICRHNVRSLKKKWWCFSYHHALVFMIPHSAGSCPAQFREGCFCALSKTIRSQGIKVQTLQTISYFDRCPISKVPVVWVVRYWNWILEQHRQCCSRFVQVLQNSSFANRDLKDKKSMMLAKLLKLVMGLKPLPLPMT